MALCHAQPGEVIDARPLGASLAGSRTIALLRTEDLELIRLVVPRGKEIPTHKSHGSATIQCLEGRVSLSTNEITQVLDPGRLVYLPAGEPHSLVGLDDASLLVTILRR